MKSYVYICNLIGNLMGLIYTFYRWFSGTSAASPTNWNLAKSLYVLIPIGISAAGTSFGLLFFQRFFRLFSITLGLSAMNAGFLTVEFLFYILPNASFAFDSFMNPKAISLLLYLIFTITSITSATNNKT
ncbi:hypothetical protein JDS99_29245 [Bacillus cereus group sp. N6]|uniref:hypothetical protein n=1 Tax=Bacillus cereus group sp. N6 TaxID=2794583 RepID=UPI0018F43173|nr:hypothetical protein [Bacillus cereus group sp. N6]MBJ8113622.1 hypothetical protein [Bacillus cereus group sp. N6]